MRALCVQLRTTNSGHFMHARDGGIVGEASTHVPYQGRKAAWIGGVPTTHTHTSQLTHTLSPIETALSQTQSTL
jgi:hypothetical protein